MVGPPKTLHDLRKVEGAVRITCRACLKVTLLDREETITMQVAHRQSVDWRSYVSSAFCPECASHDIRVTVAPFSEDDAMLRARRAQTTVVNLALLVLTDAAGRTADSGEPPHAVRLALRVLHPHVQRQELLTTYWTELTSEDQRPWRGAHQALRWIVTRLIERGYPVWAELR